MQHTESSLFIAQDLRRRMTAAIVDHGRIEPALISLLQERHGFTGPELLAHLEPCKAAAGIILHPSPFSGSGLLTIDPLPNAALATARRLAPMLGVM